MRTEFGGGGDLLAADLDGDISQGTEGLHQFPQGVPRRDLVLRLAMPTARETSQRSEIATLGQQMSGSGHYHLDRPVRWDWEPCPWPRGFLPRLFLVLGAVRVASVAGLAWLI